MGDRPREIGLFTLKKFDAELDSQKKRFEKCNTLAA